MDFAPHAFGGRSPESSKPGAGYGPRLPFAHERQGDEVAGDRIAKGRRDTVPVNDIDFHGKIAFGEAGVQGVEEGGKNLQTPQRHITSEVLEKVPVIGALVQ